MNVNEASQLLAQYENDLAAEPDPQVRAWYRLESELQPDIALAQRTMAEVTTIAGLISRIAEVKSTRSSTEGITPEEATSLGERPRILTAEEKLKLRIERRYRNLYRKYEEEISVITATKKGKREHQEMMARRQFVRNFCNFSELTGDKHIVMRADLLKTVALDLCEGDDLRDEIFLSSASFAKQHTFSVTGNPKNFAEIIASSVTGRPLSDNFEAVLKGVFSTDRQNLPELYANIAESAFEVLEDHEALALIVSIVKLEKSYVPIEFIHQNSRFLEEALAQGNIKSFINFMEVSGVIRSLTYDVTGLGGEATPRMKQAVNSYVPSPQVLTQATEHLQEILELEAIMKLGPESKETGLLYDPVEIVRPDGTGSIDLKLSELSESSRQILATSNVFRKRMEQLAPYSYSIQAAKRLFGAGAHGVIYLYSPSITVDTYVPITSSNTLPDQLTSKVEDRMAELLPQLLILSATAKENGLSSYGDSGKLRMFYLPLDGQDERNGIVIMRPAIELDKRVHASIQQLSLSHSLIKAYEDQGIMPRPDESYEEAGKKLRIAIKAERKRFFGRRPVKFMLPDYYKTVGLKWLSVRYEPASDDIRAVVGLNDGEVELRLDKTNYSIDVSDSESGLTYEGPDEIKAYFEHLVLKNAKHWLCSQEVNTSEGIITERSRNSANMGHFAYLRIRAADGYKYQPSNDQREACLEEQGLDLDVESERLKVFDPTRQERNSTYVRESFDPNQPPLVVYTKE